MRSICIFEAMRGVNAISRQPLPVSVQVCGPAYDLANSAISISLSGMISPSRSYRSVSGLSVPIAW